MRNLNKRILRGLKAQWSKNLFLFILLFFMISTTSGMLVSSGSIKTLYYELMSTGVVEDGKILFAFDPTDEILRSIEKTNVKVEKAPYVDAKINEIKDDKDEKTIRLYTNRKNINLPVINEGNLAKNKNEIAINKLFAENNDLKLFYNDGSPIMSYDAEKNEATYFIKEVINGVGEEHHYCANCMAQADVKETLNHLKTPFSMP